MSEQQKELIKKAIAKATEAWTALGAAADVMEVVRESIKQNGTEIKVVVTEDAFWSQQQHVEVYIKYLERLVRE